MTESADGSSFRALHRLVEHYTPDGTLGRTLLGGTALFVAPVLFLGGMTVLLDGAFLPVFVGGLFAFLVSVPAFLLGVLTLWPVYLWLIGNVESPSAYPDGASEPRDRRETPEGVLKRRYAAGDLTREEFERRLGDVMGTRGHASGDARPGEDDRERSRNR